jgi:hypothetical protein
MSVGTQVGKAIDAVAIGDLTGAFHDICSCVEATASKEYGGGGRTNYKKFIANNYVLITRITFGRQICMLRVAYNHPEMVKFAKADANGLFGIDDILYHAVRCALYHTAELPSTLRFENASVIKADGGNTLVLPSNLVTSLIVAVATSPANSAEKTAYTGGIRIGDIDFPLSQLWGKRQEVIAALDSLSIKQRQTA